MNIGFLLFDNVTQLDFTGPLQVLFRIPDATIVIVAKSLGSVTSDSALRFLPTHSFSDCPQLDVLVVPGGHGVREAINDPDLIAFVKHQASGCRYVTSVCTGAFILGVAGVLKGKRATTHWAYTSLLGRVGARYAEQRVVEDGSIVTGGGVTAGLDFAFTLLARLKNKEFAQRVQLGIEYDPSPPFKGGTPNTSPNHIKTEVERYYGEHLSRFSRSLDEALNS